MTKSKQSKKTAKSQKSNDEKIATRNQFIVQNANEALSFATAIETLSMALKDDADETLNDSDIELTLMSITDSLNFKAKNLEAVAKDYEKIEDSTTNLSLGVDNLYFIGNCLGDGFLYQAPHIKLADLFYSISWYIQHQLLEILRCLKTDKE